ncbi:MAG: response regulator [Prochloraceae cyanobacterium]
MPPGNKTEVLSEDAIAKINELYHKRFTGSLRINTNSDLPEWKIYFRLGRIIWAKGGAYPNLRWRRYSNLINRVHLKEIENPSTKINRQYGILIDLYKMGNSLEKGNLTQLVKNVVAEILFDIIQYSVVGQNNLSYQVSSEDNLGSFLTLIDTEKLLARTMQDWVEWESAGLSSCSPNLFPAIENLQLFHQKLSSSKHQYSISIIDGLTSLRTLALKNNISLIELTELLFELSKSDAVSFSSIPKSKKLNVPIIIGSESTNLEDYYQQNLIVSPPSSDDRDRSSQLLIVGVDDSLFICQGLGKIVTRAGYRFIGIQDPVKAMLIVLNTKPDLIFLDVIMPVIDGYELCSQLRKNPQVHDTPIVLLTSKDKLKNRIQAKLAGASGIVSKPAKPATILEAIYKYLPQSGEKRS